MPQISNASVLAMGDIFESYIEEVVQNPKRFGLDQQSGYEWWTKMEMVATDLGMQFKDVLHRIGGEAEISHLRHLCSRVEISKQI